MDVGINFEGEAQQLQTAIEGLERSLVGLIAGAQKSEKALQDVKLTMAQAAETAAAAEIEKKALKGIEDQAKETQKTWAGMPGSWRLTARELEASMRQVQQTWKGDAGSWRTSLDTEAEKISKSIKDLDQQMKTAITGGVDVDTTKARAELDLLGKDALKAKDVIGDIKITARQALESDAAGELIKHNINDIGDEADKSKRKLLELKLAGLGGGGGGGPLGFLSPGGSGPADILGSIVPGGRRATGFGLAAAVTGATALIGPLLPSLGILAAAPAMLATLVAALGVTSLAFSDVGKAIDGNRKAYNELVPAAKQFVDLIRGDIYPLFNGLKQIAATNLLTPLTEGIKAIVDNKAALANIGGIVAELASGIGKLAESWLRFLGSTRITGQFGQIFAAGLQTILKMQPALQSMFESVLKLMQAFEPLGQFIVDIFNKAAGALASFTDKATKGGQIAGWIKDIEASARLLWNTFTALVNVLAALIQVLAPVGSLLLSAIIPALNDLAGWLRDNKGQIDEVLTGALKGLLDVARPVAGVIKDVAGAFFDFLKIVSGGDWETFFQIVAALAGVAWVAKWVSGLKIAGAAWTLFTTEVEAEATAAAAVIDTALVATGIGAIVVAIGLLTVYAATHWDQIKKGFFVALNAIGDYGTQTINFLIKVFNDFTNATLNAFLGLVKGILEAGSHIPFIGHYFQTALDDINALFDKFKIPFVGAWKDLGTQAGTAWGQSFLDQMKTATSAAAQMMQGPTGGRGYNQFGKGSLPPGIQGGPGNVVQLPNAGQIQSGNVPEKHGGRHDTSGIAGYQPSYDIDINVKPGTPVGAPEDGSIIGYGHSADNLGPGPAIYFKGDASGATYFIAHVDNVGSLGHYNQGAIIAVVSSMESPPHVHIGVVSGGGQTYTPPSFKPTPITPTGSAPAFTGGTTPKPKVPPILATLLGQTLFDKQTAAETARDTADQNAATNQTVAAVQAQIAARLKLEKVLEEEIKKVGGEKFKADTKNAIAQQKELKSLSSELTRTTKEVATERKGLATLMANQALEGILGQIPGIDGTQAAGVTTLKRQYAQLVALVKTEGSKATPQIKEQMRLLGEAIRLPNLGQASAEDRAKVTAAIKAVTDEIAVQSDKAVSAILAKGFSTQDPASVLSIKRRFDKLVETVKEAGGAAANKVVKEMDALREAIFGKDFLTASPAKRAQTLQLLNDLLTKMADVVKSHKAEFTNAWTQIADAAKAAFQARIDLMLADFDAQTAAWEEKFNAETQAFVTDAQAQLNQLQNESELADLQQALVDAQKQLQADMKGNTQDAQSALDAVKAVLGQWAQAQAIDKVQSQILGGKAGDASGDFLQRLQAAANSGQGKGTSTQDQIAKDTEAIKKAQVALAEYFLRGEAAKQNAAYAAKRAAELKAYTEARALVRQEFDRKLQDEMKQFDLLLAVIQAKLISDYQKGDPTSLANADTLLKILAGVTGVSPEEVTAWETIMKNAINATTPEQAAAIAAQINKALAGGGLDPLQGVGEAVKEAMAAGAPVSELVSILQQAGLSKDQIAGALKDAGIDPVAIAQAIANIPDAPKASDTKNLPPAIAKALGPGFKGLPPNIAKELAPYLKNLPPDIAAALAPYLSAMINLLGGVASSLGAAPAQGGMPHLQSGGITLGNIIAQLHGQGGGEAVIPLNSPMFANKIAIVAPGGLNNVPYMGGGSPYGGGRQHWEGPPLKMPDVNVTVETHVDGNQAAGWMASFIDHKIKMVTPAISKAIGVRAQINRREGRVR